MSRPPRDNHILGRSVVVGGRHQRSGGFDLDEHAGLHPLPPRPTSRLEEAADVFELHAFRQDAPGPLEPVAFAEDRVHDVDLHARVAGEVREGVRRTQVQKTRCSSSQTLVVPLGERLDVPSEETVATKPSACSSTTRFMRTVSLTSVRLLVWWIRAGRRRALRDTPGNYLRMQAGQRATRSTTLPGTPPLRLASKACWPRSKGNTSPTTGLTAPVSIRRASSASVGLSGSQVSRE